MSSVLKHNEMCEFFPLFSFQSQKNDLMMKQKCSNTEAEYFRLLL